MKRIRLLALGMAVLLLAGCSLARPEAAPAEGGGDRWVGFYVVPSRGYVDHLADNPYVEEYGTFQAETDRFGTLAFPREVLFAEKDEAWNFTFPGIEKGFSLFFYREDYGEDRTDAHLGVVSNMAPGEETTQIKYADEEDAISLSGTIYMGPPLGAPAEWDPYVDAQTIWRYYDVYQAEDGRIYLNGDGDSVNGLMSKTQTGTRSWTENGDTRTETVQVSVAMKAAPRLERLVVTQFDGDNAVLRSDDLSLEKENLEVTCRPETAWLLVEEISGAETKRTVYNPPENGGEPVSHAFIRLDDAGYGLPAYLDLYPAQA